MDVPNIAADPVDRLQRRDVRTLVLAALGGALEFYDFAVFVFFALPLSRLFFPHDTAPWLAQLQVYGAFAAGYLARYSAGGRLPFRLGGAFGGLTPLLIGLLMQRLGALALAHYVALTAVIGMGVALALIVTGRTGVGVLERH